MNIELQCCALAVMMILSFIFFREKRLNLINNRLFAWSVVICCACLVFDVLSVICIYESVHGDFDASFTKLVCKLYIMLLATQGFVSTAYVLSSSLPVKRIRNGKITWKFFWIYSVGVIAILVSPIEFYMNGRVVYSYGPSTVIAYTACGLYIVAILISVITGRKQISERRFVTVLIWQAVWCVAALIQLLFPSVLIIGFASAAGLLILYIQLENPSEYLDIDTGVFNKQAFDLYVKDRFRYTKSFSLFTCKVNYNVGDVDYSLKHDTLLKVSRLLLKLDKAHVFQIEDDYFCIAYSNADAMMGALDKVLGFEDSVENMPAYGTHVVIESSDVFIGPDEFYEFLHEYEHSKEHVVRADQPKVMALRHRNRVHEMIENALNEDRVEVFFQPFYNTKTAKFSSAEALVRIRDDKDGKIIPPSEFVEAAEKNGQIISLGVRVVEKVCQFLAETDAVAKGLECVEVNVSAAQFDKDNPAKFVMDAVNRYGIEPKRINLEITETAVSNDKKNLLVNMEKLTANGVDFSLDDFGTGRSNLDYFVNLPVKNVKFDRNFTQGYFTNDKLKRLISGIVPIFHSMDINIVSEGVETKKQFEEMVALGVEYIQGYYFSKPLCGDEFLKFLEINNKEV